MLHPSACTATSLRCVMIEHVSLAGSVVFAMLCADLLVVDGCCVAAACLLHNQVLTFTSIFRKELSVCARLQTRGDASNLVQSMWVPDYAKGDVVQ